MQAEVRRRFRTTRAPFPGSWPFPGPVYGKALPVARRSVLRQPILPHFQEHPGAGQDKSCLAAGVRPHRLAYRLVIFCHLARIARYPDASASGAPRGNSPVVLGAEEKIR